MQITAIFVFYTLVCKLFFSAKQEFGIEKRSKVAYFGTQIAMMSYDFTDKKLYKLSVSFSNNE